MASRERDVFCCGAWVLHSVRTQTMSAIDTKGLGRILSNIYGRLRMRKQFFLFFAASAVSALTFAGCGDGEEGGGSPSTGGSGGSGGTGGTSGTGGSDGGSCYAQTFTSPVDGATLTVANDKNADCSDGVDIDVTVATTAPDGTKATLYADASEVGTATAAGAVFKFTGITLQSKANVTLEVRLDDDATCKQSISVTTACEGPTCEITKPVLGLTHPSLNGVPIAEGGDRASSPGQDYQAAFEVSTSVEDGQPVALVVDGTADASVALALSGVAKFPGVTLKPDGDHKVQAKCSAKSGLVGASAEVTYPVDTTAPDLTNLSPADGHFFAPADDTNAGKIGLQFKICGQTSAADALDLPASLGSGQSNFCAGIGTSTPGCAPATKGGAPGPADGGCVEIDCPGGAPFDVMVSLKDAAGNPTSKVIKGVRCASKLPTVQIIEPVDGTGSDVSKHILAASMSQPRKDEDAVKAGAQYTVAACSDVNGVATLYSQLVGATAKKVQENVVGAAAQPADNCPAGYPFVYKFPKADLETSAVNAANQLTTATELRVDVTDTSTAIGASPTVQVWVDPDVPTITEWIPNPLCGRLFQSASDVTQAVQLAATNSPVALTVTSSGTPVNYPELSYSLGFSNFGNVTFKQGANAIAATTTEPSGNAGALKSPCTVTVGNPPVVTWVAPTQASALNAATDGGAAAGWQGTLTVQTDVGGSGATVTFKVDCGGTVTTVGTANVDGSGVATLANATLPECVSATITAETSAVAGKGVGTASLTGKPIDTVVPSTPTGLAASVKDRRATTFDLTWTAPNDGTANVSGYQVRVSKQPITPANFDAAEAVAFLGAPKPAGQAETLEVNSRLIETNYYFAVAATDAAGNRSSVVSAGPAKATFNQTVLTAGTNEQLGIAIDAATSINGDVYTDLLVGGRNSNHVYVWFGSNSGYQASPDLTLTGTGGVGTRFGQGVAVVGDIDGDSFPDIAVGAPLDSGKGRVYIFKGRANWPAGLQSTQADYIIDVDSAADPKFAGSLFGISVVPLGDFDVDGAPDFAIGAWGYGSQQGYVAVVRGVPTGQSFPATVTIPAAIGTRVIAFPGDPALPTGRFGSRIVGLGPYYTGNHPAMVVSASEAGKIYSFQGDTGVSGTVQAATAKESYQGSAAPLRTGYTMNPLGAVFSSPAVGAGSPVVLTGTAGGDARLFYGNATTLFGGNIATISNSAATATGDNFGFAVFGGGFNGSTVNVSFIGGAGVDLGFSSVKLGASPAKLYLAEGFKIASSGDIVNLADIALDLPAGWAGTSFRSGPIKDMNNDGYSDLAIGEQTNGGVASYNGRVIVLW